MANRRYSVGRGTAAAECSRRAPQQRADDMGEGAPRMVPGTPVSTGDCTPPKPPVRRTALSGAGRGLDSGGVGRCQGMVAKPNSMSSSTGRLVYSRGVTVKRSRAVQSFVEDGYRKPVSVSRSHDARGALSAVPIRAVPYHTVTRRFLLSASDFVHQSYKQQHTSFIVK